MHEPVFVVETSSAHLRELLRAACAPIAPTAVFASARAARTALENGLPSVLVVGGAPLEPAVLELLREAIHRHAVPSLACVSAADLRAALQLGVLDGYARSADAVEALSQRVRSLLAHNQRSIVPSARPRSLRALPQNAPARSGAPRTPSLYRLIAVGASTGGPDAIAYLLSRLPTNLPGIVIVQHMPGTHTGAFAQRLNDDTAWKVREARDGDRIEPGVALIAPGGQHVRLQFGGFSVGLSHAGPAMRHMPSVDVFFESVTRELHANALGVLLTGMGDDGAHGLLGMRQAGAHTIAQSAASCAVYGMPRRAAELDAAVELVALQDLAERIASRCLQRVAAP
jgi:two-component system chemotaxis response regulator CheB